MEIQENYKKNLYWALLALLVVLSLYFVARFLSEIKSYHTLGRDSMSTITLTGHGEVQAVPDIATVYFTISKDAKTVKDAQALVAGIEKKAIDFLKTSNVDEKDIKAANASFYPKYEYRYDTRVVPCTEFSCPPNNGKNVIIGYTASESITVKVRNTDDVGKIMQGLGTLGVSDLNGPNFSIDDEDDLKMEARKKAIDDAKAKAKVLAKDLDVRLGKVVDFSEAGGAMPMYYGKAEMDSAVTSMPVPAQIPKGENTISSDVTITYEIK